MTLLEEENHEPVAVVRTLADFALALTLIVLMLVGTRAPVVKSSAATPASHEPVANQPELIVALTKAGLFLPQSPNRGTAPVDAPTLARQWAASSGGAPARLIVQFQSRALATDLHRALLELQIAFGTNLTTILTSPASE